MYLNKSILIDKEKVIVSDPIDGTIKSFDRDRFETMYNRYGQRALYYVQ